MHTFRMIGQSTDSYGFLSIKLMQLPSNLVKSIKSIKYLIIQNIITHAFQSINNVKSIILPINDRMLREALLSSSALNAAMFCPFEKTQKYRQNWFII